MATDGKKSYVIFIYIDIQWGEGGMGFNAGDGVKSFTLPSSQTPAARDVKYGSNVNINGVYAYRVDLPDIASPEGESSVLAMSVIRKKMIHIYIYYWQIKTELYRYFI